MPALPRCESKRSDLTDEMQLFLRVFLILWILVWEFFFWSVWVLLMRPQQRRLLAVASVICGLIIAQAAWLNFPPLSGLRMLRKHTCTHTFTLIFVTQSVLSLARSLTRSCMPFPDVCLSVLGLGLYSLLCLNHMTCLTSEMSHVKGFGGGEEDKGRLGKLHFRRSCVDLGWMALARMLLLF